MRTAIEDWSFTVWSDGVDWHAQGIRLGMHAVDGYGSTPVTAMISAETKARLAQRSAKLRSVLP